MKLWVGTSGFSYKEWKGTFYPEDLPNNKMLNYYSDRLRSVEINNTFYRMPKIDLLQGWTEQVPENFRFVLKASRKITHFKKLKDAADETNYLCETALTLGQRLGVILFQLPPYLRKDTEVLRDFLDVLPEGVQAAFEFRHRSWFEKDVYNLLQKHNCALCVADTEDKESHVISTANWGYLRMRRPDYKDANLEQWAKETSEQNWTHAFVFFKHEDAGAGPRMAARFMEIAEAV